MEGLAGFFVIPYSLGHSSITIPSDATAPQALFSE